MNTKPLTLIKIETNIDNKLDLSIILFYFTDCRIKQKYNDDDITITLVYEYSDKINNYYTNNSNNDFNIDFDNFEAIMISQKNHLQKIYLEKRLYEKRKLIKPWYDCKIHNLSTEYNICFKFSHYQESTFKHGLNSGEIIPCDPTIKTVKETGYVILSKEKACFVLENQNGLALILNGIVKGFESDSLGRIKKIITKSIFAFGDYEDVIYEFDSIPCTFLDKSEHNIIVSIKGKNYYDPYITIQWSLMFGQFEGIVDFNISPRN